MEEKSSTKPVASPPESKTTTAENDEKKALTIKKFVYITSLLEVNLVYRISRVQFTMIHLAL